jgi:superfamily II DNA/RNA helicase
LRSFSSSPVEDSAAALQRYARHLEKLHKLHPKRDRIHDNDEEDLPDVLGEERDTIYQEYIVLPAHELKKKLMNRNLPINGRKPDLARRLTRDDMYRKYGIDDTSNGKKILSHAVPINDVVDEEKESSTTTERKTVTHFAGIRLSDTTSRALSNAGFTKPTPIQKVAIPHIFSTQKKKIQAPSSCILHATTGSGKTLAYLIPILETFQYRQLNNVRARDDNHVALILTPTRELAAQVAGIAETMAPPGMVRLILRPTNLMKQNSNDDYNSDIDQSTEEKGRISPPKIYVGSAKSIYVSLYGDENLPASPTSKPEALFLLQHTQFIVLDEVDRLLNINSASSSNKHRHEKPAAILTAAVMRLTLGKACIVAASATVGRPLKRELSRVMGLSPQECPPVLRAKDEDDQSENETPTVTTKRAVTMPDSVRHFVVPIVEHGSSPGKVLTSAYQVIQKLNPGKRMLLVLTRNFGISVANAIGALRHFGAKHAMDLVQALEEADGAAQYIDKHRKITGALGVGESSRNRENDKEGYLLVTGEDSVRGLHLDRLDVVIIAGRTKGPDEYTHVAGRTGRSGESGICINVVDSADGDKLVSWEKMLGIQFQRVPNLEAIRNIS